MKIKPIILPEVYNCLKKINIDFNQYTRYNTIIKEWLHPIIDLKNFYVYPTNGITEGLNYWMGNESRGIFKDDGDYQWVDCTGTEIKYVTCPSTIHGNFIDIPTDVPVALDIAYVGSTKIQKIKIDDNVEKVFFSLSKSFGLRTIRTGWYFSRKPDVKLHKLHYKNKYYNYFAHLCAETIIKNFPIDYVYNKLNAQQKSICNNLNINQSDSVWLGYSYDDNYTKLSITNYFKNYLDET
tara:strand:- start:7221 stop:7934 length:714 start_codon:yes stop_codon:yes gene_type:complete